MPDPAPLELLLTAPSATAPLRVVLRRALTTIGSVAGADVRIAGVAPHWLVVQAEPSGATVVVMATGERHRLAANQAVVVDGIRLLLAPPAGDDGALPIGQLADALAGVDSPDEALALLLERVMSLTDSDKGAIILNEGAGYVVAVTRDRDGRPLDNAEALISDTIVTDALASGAPVRAGNLPAHERYRNVTSVVALSLGAVFVAPMVLGERDRRAHV